MYYEARGGEAGMMNRMEQSELQRTGHRRVSAAQEVAAQAVGREHIEGWNTVLRRNAAGGVQSVPPMPLPGLEVAKTVAADLGAMNGQVVGVTLALGAFKQALASFAQSHGNAPPVTASPGAGRRFDINAGMTLAPPTPDAAQAAALREE